MWEFVFIASLSLIFFAYFGYPLTLLIVGWFTGKPVKRAPVTPRVTFIITVHNEETRIESKLKNTLCLDYPKDSLEILVASDG